MQRGCRTPRQGTSRNLLSPGATEPTLAPLGLIEVVYDNQLAIRNLCNHELRDAVATFDNERLLAMIDHDHLELTAIITVHGSRTIQQRDSMLESQTAARPHLSLMSRRNGH